MNWREELHPLIQSIIDEETNLPPGTPMGNGSIIFGAVIQDYPNWKTDYYPEFPEHLRNRLNAKIEDRFFFREISEEEPVPGRFFHFLKRKLNEVLPKYMYRYQLEEEGKIDILKINKTTNTYSSSQEGSTTITQNDKSRNVFSEYPQSQLSGNADYATNANDTASTTNTSNINNGTIQSNNLNETEGYSIDLMNKFADEYIDTDVLVLDELEVCFRSMTSKPMNQI